MPTNINFSSKASLVWQSANEILRDVFKRSEYPDIDFTDGAHSRIESVFLQTSRKDPKAD